MPQATRFSQETGQFGAQRFIFLVQLARFGIKVQATYAHFSWASVPRLKVENKFSVSGNMRAVTVQRILGSRMRRKLIAFDE